jgi:hypothetical protein
LLRQRFAGGLRVVEDIMVGNILSGWKCSTKFDLAQLWEKREIIPLRGCIYLGHYRE